MDKYKTLSIKVPKTLSSMVHISRLHAASKTQHYCCNLQLYLCASVDTKWNFIIQTNPTKDSRLNTQNSEGNKIWTTKYIPTSSFP